MKNPEATVGGPVADVEELRCGADGKDGDDLTNEPKPA